VLLVCLGGGEIGMISKFSWMPFMIKAWAELVGEHSFYVHTYVGVSLLSCICYWTRRWHCIAWL
jgi:hypothetical protein